MKKLSASSWKTTSSGILVMAGALVNLYFNRHNLNEMVVMVGVTQIVSGIGLLVARDNDKTSEDVGTSTKPQNLVPPKP